LREEDKLNKIINMFGFPIGNGNSGSDNFIEKFTNNADSGFPKIQQREVFYSVRDGSWDDASIWQTASGRVGKTPTQFDDVYIRNNVTNSNAGVTNVYNLFISNTLNLTSGGFIFIYNNIQCNGLLNITGGMNIYLLGSNNYIKNCNIGTSTFVYASAIECNILELPYYNLMIGDFNFPATFGRVGVKYLTNNLTITNTLTLRAGVLEVGSYDLTVNGATAIGANGGFISKLSKVSGGNLTFIGNLQTQAGGAAAGFFSLDFSGNPTVELRGGLSMNGMLGNPLNSGTGTFRFTTNNQSIGFTTGATSVTFDCVFQIENINLSFGAGPGGTAFFNNIIIGTTPTSTFTNRQVINLSNTVSATGFMTTGIADLTSFANTVSYGGNYSVTLPPHIITYSSLSVSGTGTKTFGVNTVMNGRLTAASGATIDLWNYSITATIALVTNGPATIIRGIACSDVPLTIGTYTTAGATGSTLNVGTTNDIIVTIGGTFNLGLNTITCRNLIFNASATVTHSNQGATWNCDIYVKSGVTVTLTTQTLTHNGGWIGDDVTSTFIISSTGTYSLNKNVPLLSPGTTTNNGSVYYIFNGDRTLDFTTYVNLSISGTTGTKTLLGDTTVTKLIAARTLELSTYNLTVNGDFTIGNAQIIRTPVSSGKLFKFNNIIAGASGGTVNVGTTNNVEMTGTSFQLNQNTFTCNQFIVSNNATFGAQAQSLTIVGELFIKSGFTLTFNQNTTLTMTGLNGESATSKYVAGAGTTNYRGATQPMVTGILDTGTNLNTWIYGLNNQDIKGSPTISPKQVYRNLRFSGSGTTKTLQGFVSVLNTYTLDAGVTVNNNGYTLTNP